jgi:uncharacterized protein YuzE
MTQDETTDDVQVEQQENETVTVEETGAEEAVVESQSDDTTVTPDAELAKAKAEAAKYRRLFEKTQAKPTVATPKAPQTASPFNVEETVLLANGMNEDLMVELKAVAKVRGISLIKAQTDPIFVAVKEKFEKDKKRDDASLPASRNSGGVKARKTVSTPGLSREEHMALVKGRA